MSASQHLDQRVRVCAFMHCDYSGNTGLYKIPNDSRQNKWLEISKISESDVTTKTSICLRHFQPEDFYTNSNRLRPWAIPHFYHVSAANGKMR